MGIRSKKRALGFSLLEMTIAMALGTLVVGAAVQLYSQGVAATWTVSQRAEMQQDFRAASNMLTKDLSLAGVGLGQGVAIQLPTSGTIPVYGCAQTGGLPCYLGTANATGAAYPKQGATPYLYGLLPGYNAGPTINGLPTDVVTVVYADSSFYLDCYTATVASTTTVTFTAIVPTAPATSSANCTAPTGNAGAQAINDSVFGLTSGDLVLFTFGAKQVVAEINGTVSATTATFGSGDALNMNQAAADPKSLASITTGTTGFATRILVITYYIDNTVSPPRLMKQVSGHTPTPIVDGVTYLKFTYDLYNDATSSPAVACSNPGAASDGCAGASAGLLPNQVTKINIAHMSMNSTMKGAVGGYQGLDLETSVSARDLTYSNSYPIIP
jgi:Tfp pilus assembly protein PilW